jgi:hypothetical protein
MTPWAPGSGGRTITIVTRRDIFDYLRTGRFSWHGQLDELPFLGRLYDLDFLPSTDGRFSTAAGDIRQHRISNDDWDDDWIFTDSRLKLASGPDDVLMAAMVTLPGVQLRLVSGSGSGSRCTKRASRAAVPSAKRRKALTGTHPASRGPGQRSMRTHRPSAGSASGRRGGGAPRTPDRFLRSSRRVLS